MLRSFLCVLLVLLFSFAIQAQSGTSSLLSGSVVDPSGAVVSAATVEIANPVSGFTRTVTTDAQGRFSVPNVPFNPYHLTVHARGFAAYSQDVSLRSTVPVELKIQLAVEAAGTTVDVQGSGGDLLETTPVAHTDVDRGLFDKLPLESASSSVSSLVTLATPGIAADSNGLFHGLGDHAENSFSVDGQPITDQQSKVFSNQIPLDSVESMEVIQGAPPAEFGDKTSVVINVTTRSGLGVTTPHGAVTTSYGSFGTSTLDANLAYGGKRWGNFVSLSGMDSGRFLDPPEFQVMHDKGNEENAFDRIDLQFTNLDTLHLNLGYTRSWFQTPNSYDAQFATAWTGAIVAYGGIGPDGAPVGASDQRNKINTFNLAPSWSHLLGSNGIFTFGAFARRDSFAYFPSADPFADLAPGGVQLESVGQYRTLTNLGLRTDLSYVKGIHNIKIGATFQHTRLHENDSLGVVDPTFLPSLTDANGDPCFVAGVALVSPCTELLPHDLTRGGTDYNFQGHGDVRQVALYAQDAITKGSWTFNLGIRGDFYHGLTSHNEAEPRLGIAYNIKRTNTVLHVSYARTLETPFNENLVLSSVGCDDAVLSTLLGCFASDTSTPLSPGWRNEFHTGLEQAFGKYLVFSGEYIWKYTHNGYDFSVLGNTPITFPVEWNNSKIPGVMGRVSVPDFHGLTALMVFSSVSARFFTPQLGGAGAVPFGTVGSSDMTPFRIDHDERFNMTAHFQYQPLKRGPWFGFNWRYDSGLVAGAAPCYGVMSSNSCPSSVLLGGQPAIDLSGFSADQEFQAGFFCGSAHATPFVPLPSPCPASQFGSTLISIPAINAENDDKNPPRIAPRHLFDVAVGDDNLFGGDRYKWSVRLTAINIANTTALYNFLSTFSGTHYVTPRALTAELGFHF